MSSPQEDGVAETPQAVARGGRKGLYAARAIFLIILAVASVWVYNTVAEQLARRHDAAQPRNNQGVLLGAEELTLGPDDADTAVLLVHGFIGARNNFGELPERLASEGYRVRALRLPGHGTTPMELAKVPASDHISAVLNEARALQEQHERVVIVGHSMGGALSTLAAATLEVDGLVLAAPYYRVTAQWYYLAKPETWSSVTGSRIRWAYKGDTFVRVKREEVKDDIVSYRWVPSAATAAANKLAERARQPEVLEIVRCPVLMMHSRDDFAASPEAAEQAFEQMGSDNKRLVWLENSDHHLFWDHDREEVIGEVVRFVGEIASR